MHYIFLFFLLKFLSFKYIIQIFYSLKKIVMIIKTDHIVTMNITQIIGSNIVLPTQTFFFSLLLGK